MWTLRLFIEYCWVKRNVAHYLNVAHKNFLRLCVLCGRNACSHYNNNSKGTYERETAAWRYFAANRDNKITNSATTSIRKNKNKLAVFSLYLAIHVPFLLLLLIFICSVSFVWLESNDVHYLSSYFGIWNNKCLLFRNITFFFLQLTRRWIWSVYQRCSMCTVQKSDMTGIHFVAQPTVDEDRVIYSSFSRRFAIA